MKNFYTFLLVGYTVFSFGQNKLEGIYCVDNPTGDFFECLEFKGNGFSFEEGGHGGIHSYGSGTFDQTDKYLILNYNQTKPLELSYHKLKFWINSNPVIDLKVNAMDLKGNKIRGANIFVSNSKYGVVADTLGYGQLKLEKKDQNLELIISYLGYVRETIQLRQDFNYEIDVYLKEGSMPTPILHQTDTLKINQYKKDSFEVINKNSRVRGWNKRLQEN
ncbi:carboxypeptidase-like regulatory domain-containing protein [Salegentibacter salarius]|uniref:Carboxypeptidase-like regulatory domain-containing protein n=1 Tax=Salegentibacter salarius TaxID=435906 RepID=A0A2N0TR82_9FLAO|nr:carboxypeptidase-like regulatory domain-containing protein [Salegentibacter salarius]OEY71906.1 hypothetical protein BHS39_14915 [Salegentibacter salarius]PKD17254.1 hypothetical protein APR40_14885 [Salegentibacter salarius]SLK06148.1 hypothetical protein SAMN05660445_03081 [Salegentibacter salarius]